MADAVFIETAARCLAVYSQRDIRRFILIAVRVVALFVEAGAAGSLLAAGVLAVNKDIAAAAAVVRVVNTGLNIAVQSYHGIRPPLFAWKQHVSSRLFRHDPVLSGASCRDKMRVCLKKENFRHPLVWIKDTILS
jgi:hypothetical protein